MEKNTKFLKKQCNLDYENDNLSISPVKMREIKL